eukprot:6190757-Pleurochrysis_carterae.AAC.1
MDSRTRISVDASRPRLPTKHVDCAASPAPVCCAPPQNTAPHATPRHIAMPRAPLAPRSPRVLSSPPPPPDPSTPLPPPTPTFAHFRPLSPDARAQVLLAIRVLMGGSPVDDLIGIFSGHVYYFLEDVQNVRLSAPAFLRDLLDGPAAGAPQPNRGIFGGHGWGAGQRLGG